LTQNMIHFQIV